MSDRLVEIEDFFNGYGYRSVTEAQAQWLITEIKRQRVYAREWEDAAKQQVEITKSQRLQIEQQKRLPGVLRAHYLKVPKDFVCACGQTWVPNSFEEGIDLWIEHIQKVLTDPGYSASAYQRQITGL